MTQRRASRGGQAEEGKQRRASRGGQAEEGKQRRASSSANSTCHHDRYVTSLADELDTLLEAPSDAPQDTDDDLDELGVTSNLPLFD
jgi:hypothetical protein